MDDKGSTKRADSIGSIDVTHKHRLPTIAAPAMHEINTTTTSSTLLGGGTVLPSDSQEKNINWAPASNALTEGIGTLDLEVVHAHRCSPKCSKLQQETNDGEGHCMDVLEGDSYCRIRFGDIKPRRTRTVYQTANPRFDECWRLVVPYYRAILMVELIDAAREKPIGNVKLSTFQILQKQADALAEGRELDLYEDHPLRDGDKTVGVLRIKVSMQEDTQLFLAKKPRSAPKSPQEDFGLENLKRVLDRLQAVIGIIKV